MDIGTKRIAGEKEGLAEYLVSELMKYTSLDPAEYVRYENGTINGISGCRSKDFLKKDQELITFYRLYYNEMGKNLAMLLNGMQFMEERIEYVIDFIGQKLQTEY